MRGGNTAREITTIARSRAPGRGRDTTTSERASKREQEASYRPEVLPSGRGLRLGPRDSGRGGPLARRFGRWTRRSARRRRRPRGARGERASARAHREEEQRAERERRERGPVALGAVVVGLELRAEVAAPREQRDTRQPIGKVQHEEPEANEPGRARARAGEWRGTQAAAEGTMGNRQRAALVVGRGGALACSVGWSILTGCSTSGTNGGSPSCAGRRAADGWPVSLGLFDRPSAPAMLAPTSKKGGSLPRPVRANSAPLCVREGLKRWPTPAYFSSQHESCRRHSVHKMCHSHGEFPRRRDDERTEDTLGA